CPDRLRFVVGDSFRDCRRSRESLGLYRASAFEWSSQTISQRVGSVSELPNALTPGPGSPFPGAGGKIAMDPKGRLVYAKTGTSAVSVYSLDFFTGALTPIPGSPSTFL